MTDSDALSSVMAYIDVLLASKNSDQTAATAGVSLGNTCTTSPSHGSSSYGVQVDGNKNNSINNSTSVTGSQTVISIRPTKTNSFASATNKNNSINTSTTTNDSFSQFYCSPASTRNGSRPKSAATAEQRTFATATTSLSPVVTRGHAQNRPATAAVKDSRAQLQSRYRAGSLPISGRRIGSAGAANASTTTTPPTSDSSGTREDLFSSPLSGRPALSPSYSSTSPSSIRLLPIQALQWDTFVDFKSRRVIEQLELEETNTRERLVIERDTHFKNTIALRGRYLRLAHAQQVDLHNTLVGTESSERQSIEIEEERLRLPISHMLCACTFGKQYLMQVLRRGAIIEDDLMRERKFTVREEGEARHRLVVLDSQGRKSVEQRLAANIQRLNRRAQDFTRAAKVYASFFSNGSSSSPTTTSTPTSASAMVSDGNNSNSGRKSTHTTSRANSGFTLNNSINSGRIDIASASSPPFGGEDASGITHHRRATSASAANAAHRVATDVNNLSRGKTHLALQKIDTIVAALTSEPAKFTQASAEKRHTVASLLKASSRTRSPQTTFLVAAGPKLEEVGAEARGGRYEGAAGQRWWRPLIANDDPSSISGSMNTMHLTDQLPSHLVWLNFPEEYLIQTQSRGRADTLAHNTNSNRINNANNGTAPKNLRAGEAGGCASSPLSTRSTCYPALAPPLSPQKRYAKVRGAITEGGEGVPKDWDGNTHSGLVPASQTLSLDSSHMQKAGAVDIARVSLLVTTGEQTAPPHQYCSLHVQLSSAETIHRDRQEEHQHGRSAIYVNHPASLSSPSPSHLLPWARVVAGPVRTAALVGDEGEGEGQHSIRTEDKRVSTLSGMHDDFSLLSSSSSCETFVAEILDLFNTVVTNVRKSFETRCHSNGNSNNNTPLPPNGSVVESGGGVRESSTCLHLHKDGKRKDNDWGRRDRMGPLIRKEEEEEEAPKGEIPIEVSTIFSSIVAEVVSELEGFGDSSSSYSARAHTLPLVECATPAATSQQQQKVPPPLSPSLAALASNGQSTSHRDDTKKGTRLPQQQQEALALLEKNASEVRLRASVCLERSHTHRRRQYQTLPSQQHDNHAHTMASTRGSGRSDVNSEGMALPGNGELFSIVLDELLEDERQKIIMMMPMKAKVDHCSSHSHSTVPQQRNGLTTHHEVHEVPSATALYLLSVKALLALPEPQPPYDPEEDPLRADRTNQQAQEAGSSDEKREAEGVPHNSTLRRFEGIIMASELLIGAAAMLPSASASATKNSSLNNPILGVGEATHLALGLFYSVVSECILGLQNIAGTSSMGKGSERINKCGIEGDGRRMHVNSSVSSCADKNNRSPPRSSANKANDGGDASYSYFSQLKIGREVSALLGNKSSSAPSVLLGPAEGGAEADTPQLRPRSLAELEVYLAEQCQQDSADVVTGLLPPFPSPSPSHRAVRSVMSAREARARLRGTTQVEEASRVADRAIQSATTSKAHQKVLENGAVAVKGLAFYGLWLIHALQRMSEILGELSTSGVSSSPAPQCLMDQAALYETMFQRVAYFPIVSFYWSLSSHRIYQSLIHDSLGVGLGAMKVPVDIAFRETYPIETNLLGSKRVIDHFKHKADQRRQAWREQRAKEEHSAANTSILLTAATAKTANTASDNAHNTRKSEKVFVTQGPKKDQPGKTEGHVNVHLPRGEEKQDSLPSLPPPSFHVALLRRIEDSIVNGAAVADSTAPQPSAVAPIVSKRGAAYLLASKGGLYGGVDGDDYRLFAIPTSQSVSDILAALLSNHTRPFANYAMANSKSSGGSSSLPKSCTDTLSILLVVAGSLWHDSSDGSSCTSRFLLGRENDRNGDGNGEEITRTRTKGHESDEDDSAKNISVSPPHRNQRSQRHLADHEHSFSVGRRAANRESAHSHRSQQPLFDEPTDEDGLACNKRNGEDSGEERKEEEKSSGSNEKGPGQQATCDMLSGPTSTSLRSSSPLSLSSLLQAFDAWVPSNIHYGQMMSLPTPIVVFMRHMSTQTDEMGEFE